MQVFVNTTEMMVCGEELVKAMKGAGRKGEGSWVTRT